MKAKHAIQFEINEQDIKQMKDLIDNKSKEIIWEFNDEITGEPVTIRLVKEKKEKQND